jgi:hypothetical protein
MLERPFQQNKNNKTSLRMNAASGQSWRTKQEEML